MTCLREGVWIQTLELFITVRHEALFTKTYVARVKLRTNTIQKVALREVQSTALAKPSSRDIEKHLKQHLRQ